MSLTVALEAKGITKEFPGVRALNQVTFQVLEGEVHSLCGENGAGKSTLMKIASGVYPAGTYTGDLVVRGETRQFLKTSDSGAAGIAIVFQELSLVPEMTVAENIFLGREPATAGVVNWSCLISESQKTLQSLGLQIRPTELIKNLGVGEKQLVEIAKALSRKPRILILDEPTSALSAQEIRIFMSLVKRLKSDGVSVILISHKLDEVFDVSDRITVLRDGATIQTLNARETNPDHIISLMVGREIKDLYPTASRSPTTAIFAVEKLSVPHAHIPGRMLLNQISWSVRKGEILGISGLMGSGRTEMLMSIFGALSAPRTGQFYLEGKPLKLRTPADAISSGLALASEDRKRYGLVLESSVRKNVTLSALHRISTVGVVDNTQEARVSKEYVNRFRIKTPGLDSLIKNLSGGNQQKVVLSKCLFTNPRVLFLDEPTRGIDVGAKAEIYHQIHELANQGLAIVLVSSELPEILGMSDRILVLCEGRVTAEFSRAEATEEKIMAAATRFERKV